MLKWSLLLCLVWASLAVAQDPVAFGDLLNITTTAQTFTFLKSLSADRSVTLNIRTTTGASSFSLTTVTALTDGVAPIPDGYNPAAGLGGQGGGDGRTYFRGYQFALNGGTAQATLTTPGLSISLNLIGQVSNFQVVFFNPLNSQYTVLTSTFEPTNRTLSFSFTLSGTYFIVFPSPLPATKPLGSSFLISGNSQQTVSVSAPANPLQPLLTIGNIRAAASGTLTVNISAQATARSAAVVAPRTLVSQVFSIGYDSAITSAVVEYDYQLSGNTGLTPSQLSWYRWDTATAAWVAVPSTIEAAFVVAQTTTLGEWSVQSSPQTNSPAVSTVQGSSSLQPTATFTGDGVVNPPPAGTALAAANTLASSPITIAALALTLLAAFFNAL
jgi:hypothetical protein